MWSQVLGQKSCSPSSKLDSLLVNMILMSRIILALGLFSSTLGTDLHEEEKSDLKRLQADFGTDVERHSLDKSGLSKRSAGLNEQTCTALPGVEAALQKDTHSVSEWFMFLFTQKWSLFSRGSAAVNSLRGDFSVCTWSCSQCPDCKQLQHTQIHEHPFHLTRAFPSKQDEWFRTYDLIRSIRGETISRLIGQQT